MSCTSWIRPKNRKICSGDLSTAMQIQVRSITAPVESEYGLSFTDSKTVYGMVETVNGETVFDGTNTEQVITHRIYVRFDPSITAETWVLLDNERLNIVTVENLDAKREFQLLRCNNRGTADNAVNAT